MEHSVARPRLPALTSLRFFAALHVFFFHLLAFKILWSQGWLRSLASIGYVGVSFFFVLSGFILVYTYAGRDAAPREFWRARFARVYPAFLFALLMTAPFFFYAVFKLDFPLFAWSARHLKLSVAMVLLLLQAWVPAGALAWNPVAWSLSDEAFFYAAFPFLLRKIAKLGIAALALVALACWAASLGITWTYVLRNPDHLALIDADVLSAFWLNAVKFLPLFRLPEFVIGMACGMLFLKSSKDSRLALPLILGGLIVSAFAALYAAKIPYPVLHTSLLAPAFAAIIYGFALRPSWGAILEWKPLVFLGDASYSMYLLHTAYMGPFFFTMTNSPRHQSYGGVALYLAIIIAVSGLVHRFIEEPARRLLRGRRRESAFPSVTQPPAQGALA
jgi:peptidoglycan/LPS O-acetylase OafA/YrhL